MNLAEDDLEIAVDEILASLERRPESAATLDGINVSAAGTGKLILSKLRAAEMTELAGKLEAALTALDPKLLELPEFERGGPRRPRRQR